MSSEVEAKAHERKAELLNKRELVSAAGRRAAVAALAAQPPPAPSVQAKAAYRDWQWQLIENWAAGTCDIASMRDSHRCYLDPRFFDDESVVAGWAAELTAMGYAVRVEGEFLYIEMPELGPEPEPEPGPEPEPEPEPEPGLETRAV